MAEGRNPFAWSPGPKVREICTTQVYTPRRCWNCGKVHPWEQPCVGSGPLRADPFSDTRAELRSIEHMIDSVWADFEAVLPDLLDRGEYDAVDYLRGQTFEKARALKQEWVEVRKLLPPFTTYKDRVFYRHPVTEENRHLLVRGLGDI